MTTRPGHDPAVANAAWRQFVARVRCGLTLPFADHWQLYEEVFRDRRAEDGPPLAWQPDEEERDRSNLGLLMAELGFASFAELATWSRTERAEFWGEVVRRLGIVFRRPPDTVLSLDHGDLRWLRGARLNIASSCFQSDPERVAVVTGREGEGGLQHTSYGELERLVDRVAAGLQMRGLGEGAAVALYMPMTLECVAAYLGVVKAGGSVVSIADSFAPEEVARRLEIGGAAAVVTVDRFRRGGREVDLYQRVLQAGAPLAVVIPEQESSPPPLRPGDLLWSELLGAGRPLRGLGWGPVPDDQHPLLLRHHRRPQGDPLDPHDPDQVRRGRPPPPRHPARRRGRVADQHRLDDGPVAGLRRPGQPRDASPCTTASPHGRGLRRASSRTPGVTMLGVVPSLVRRLARHPGACRRRRLEPDPGVQLDRRALQPRRTTSG